MPAYRRAEQRQHFLATYFASRNTKNCDSGKARTGRKFIFPTPLFLPASPERSVLVLPREVRQSKFNFRIFLKIGSDFIQYTPLSYGINRRDLFLTNFWFILWLLLLPRLLLRRLFLELLRILPLWSRLCRHHPLKKSFACLFLFYFYKRTLL